MGNKPKLPSAKFRKLTRKAPGRALERPALKVLTNHGHVIERVLDEPVVRQDAHLDAETILMLLREHNMPHHANVLSLRLCGYTYPEVGQALGLSERHVAELERSGHTIARLLLRA